VAYCDKEDLNRHATALLSALEPLRKKFRTRTGAELSHVLRVRTSQCRSCGGASHLYPGLLVSVRSRFNNEHQAYFGCPCCGAVSLRNKRSKSFVCDGCGQKHDKPHNDAQCAHCGSEDVAVTSRWHPFLVQELVLKAGALRGQVRPPEAEDPVRDSTAREYSRVVGKRIATGIETRRLLDAGFQYWPDLYTERQLKVLEQAIDQVKALDTSTAIKDRLAYAVLGAAEMPGYLSRWDRFHLKAFEAAANHRFGNVNVAVETNLLSPVGRGTLPRRLTAAAKALDWLIEVGSGDRRIRSCDMKARGRKPTNWDVLIATGSSRRQALPDRSVNVVITDPPYFADVQYGELARLFHYWLERYSPQTVVDESDEAVPNSHRGATAEDYTNTIAACLAESKRTLKPGGRVILTFHNKKLVAWEALAKALRKAGLVIHALAVVLAENDGDHCKRTVEAMLHDLVIECVPAGMKRRAAVHLAFKPVSAADKNLAAIGLAMADFARAYRPTELATSFASQLERMRARKRLIN
jgi:Zn finger protein HypA/HybF involved in hydrogenase expression